MNTAEVVALARRQRGQALPMDDFWRGEFDWLYTHARADSDDPTTRNAARIYTVNGIAIEGVNRFPAPLRHVRREERLVKPDKYAEMIHAEACCVLRAARQGIATEGGWMICPWAPCRPCAGKIIEAGLEALVIHHELMQRTPDRWLDEVDAGLRNLSEAGVAVLRIRGQVGTTKGGMLLHRFNGEDWNP